MKENINKYSLLQEELEDFLEPNKKGLKNKLLSSVYSLIMKNRGIRYSFLVPSSYYLRAQFLCEDITIMNDGIPFTHADLTNLLFNDFLANVRILADHHKIYSELMARDNRPPSIRNYGELIEQPSPLENPSEFITLDCEFKRNEALRLEIFLADLAELFPENPLLVEDVLQIIYCDFIKAYKLGQMKNIVERIIKHLEKN